MHKDRHESRRPVRRNDDRIDESPRHAQIVQQSSTKATLLFLSVCLSACNSSAKSSDTPTISTNAAAIAIAKLVDPNLVTLNETGISLGNDRLGDAPADVISPIEPLQTKLKAKRDAWMKEHPGEKFAAGLSVELGQTTTCRQALSVLYAVRASNYTRVAFLQGTTILMIPTSTPENSQEVQPNQDAAIELHADGNAEVKGGWSCGGAFDVVPVASLPAAVKEWSGAERDYLKKLRVRCDAGIASGKLLSALESLIKESPSMEVDFARTCDDVPRDPQAVVKAALEEALRGDPSYQPPPPASNAKRRMAKATEGAVETTGSLTPEAAREAMKPLLAHFQACYQAGLDRDPELQGQFRLKLQIGKKGAVSMLTTEGNEMPDRSVLACSQSVAGTAVFPANGATATVDYRLVLSPGGPMPAGSPPPPSAGASAEPVQDLGFVTQRNVAVVGPLTSKDIVRVTRGKAGHWDACYEAALRDTPTLAGSVTVRFVIGSDGAVSNVGKSGGDIADEKFNSCVVRTFFGAQFPQQPKLSFVFYSLDFALRTGAARH